MPRAFSRGVKSFFPLAYLPFYRISLSKNTRSIGSDQISECVYYYIYIYIYQAQQQGVRRPNIPSGIFFFLRQLGVDFQPHFAQNFGFSSNVSPNQLWTDPEKKKPKAFIPSHEITTRPTLDFSIGSLYCTDTQVGIELYEEAGVLKKILVIERLGDHQMGNAMIWFFKIPPSEPTHPLGFIYKQPP